MKNLRIRVKLNLGFLVLIAISLLVVSMISYNQFSNIIISQNKSNLIELMRQKGEGIDMSLKGIDKDFNIIANNDSLGDKVSKYWQMDPQKKIQAGNEIRSSLDDALKTRMDIADVFIVSNNNDVFYYGGDGLDINFDILADQHYLDFISSNKNSLKTIPYVSDHSFTKRKSNRVITAFYKMRISTNLKSIGSLAVNIKEDYLYDLIKDMKVNYDTKVVIVDKNNNVVMDPLNRNNNGNKYEIDIAQNIESNDINWFNKKIDKENNLVTYYEFANTDWVLVGITPISNMTKTASAIRLQILLIGLICMALAFFLSTFITRDITTGIKELIKRMDKVKRGVLVVEPLSDRKDELGVLGTRFLEMLESFRDSINDIKNISGITSKAADEISANATKNFEEFESLSTKIMDIHDKSNNQNSDIYGVNEITTELSKKIAAIINYFDGVDDSISDTKVLTTNGKQSVDILKSRSNQVAEVTTNILCTVTGLKDEFKEIEKITDTVKAVAKQTDLLALNAEIEAARLGEQGKGFSVIAKSVKELAATTGNSANYIESIISKLNDKIQELNNAVYESEKFTKEQLQSVINTTGSFDSISEIMELIVNQILKVKAEIQDINSTRERISEVMNLLKASSEDNVITSREIAVSAEDKIDLNEELVELSNHLKELATKVESKVHKFEL